MGLDIRWPIGLMFTFIGALLLLIGLWTGVELNKPLIVNINQVWGIVLLIFGVLMLYGANKGRKKDADKDTPPPPSAA